MGQKIRQTRSLCPNCGKPLTEVGHQDHHGAYEALEIHCSTVSGGCGYAYDPSNETIRNEGNRSMRNENDQSPRKKE